MSKADRRIFLKGTTASLALPLLESLTAPAAIGSEGAPPALCHPKRLVCVGVYLGFFQDAFFPKTTGRNYKTSPVLQPIEDFRGQTTIFSGLDHRGRNGHEGWRAWMSVCPRFYFRLLPTPRNHSQGRQPSF